MYKIAANRIFTNVGEPLKQSYLVFSADKVLIDVVDTQGDLQEIHSMAYYSGALIPGIVAGPDTLAEALFTSEENTHRIYYQKGFQAINKSEEPDFNIFNSLNNRAIDFDQWLLLHTLRAAEKYDLQAVLGAFQLGKKPGVLCIENFDFDKMRPSANSKIKRLL